MVRKNRIQGLRLKRGRTQKIVPGKKGTVPRKEAYKSLRISTIGSVIQFIKFFLKLILSFIFGWIIRGAVITALIISITILYYKINMPPLNEMLDARAKGSVILLDKNKENFAWRGEQFGEIAQANKISIHLKNAILAVEDKRFYRHFGISPRGIAGAVRINLNEGRGALTGHGGSTITQQTAKLLCLGIPYKANNWDSEAQYEANCRQSSLWRKVKEALFAVALELEFTKDEILTLYLNRVFLGAGSRGFQAASQRYFNKSAASLNPAEAAMLSGLLVAPSRYAPTNNLEKSQNRANVILGLMEQQGFLNAKSAQYFRENPAKLSTKASQKAGGHFADWVMQSAPHFFTNNTTEDVTIETTFDPKIQQAAEDVLENIFKEKVDPKSQAQAAIVVMSPNGAVRAMVGGRKLHIAGTFNRSTQALRQPGSAFKPLVYATALEQGYKPNDLITDEAIKIEIPGSGTWTPQNYEKKFNGLVSLTDSLSQSLNIPAVKLAQQIGLNNIGQISMDMGIYQKISTNPAIALGVSETTLLELTSAYATFLNDGIKVSPYGLEKLSLETGVSFSNRTLSPETNRILRSETAHSIVYMLEKAVSNGTGKKAKFSNWEIAGKTGTTQDARDAWFIGFTSEYIAGVWMGYDNNKPLNGVTGGGLPAEIWSLIMNKIHTDIKPQPLPKNKRKLALFPNIINSDYQPQIRKQGAGFIDKLLLTIFGEE
ncbi:MAG: PBP1A family penicillin-binding protein [Rhodobacterales bacterium]|nr:PBP1A family penicillin-binding protein [Rhodobacterales bacterium]